MKMILLYLGDEQSKKAVLSNVLSTMQLPHVFLDDTALTQSIGYLMSMDGFIRQESNEVVHRSSDLMIFDEVSDEEILAMNEALKAQDTIMKHKAMLTKHNQNWLLKDLLKEVEEEHHYFEILDEIHQLLTQSSELIIEEYTPVSWKQYEAAFYEAYDILQKQASLLEATTALKHLQETKRHLVSINK